MTRISDYMPLFKIRICSLITVSAVVGLVSASAYGSVSFTDTLFLVLFTMMASTGVSAFNHYFDMDIDAVMKRTKKRPIPAGKVMDSRTILLTATVLFIASVLLSWQVLNFMVALHLFLGGFVYAVVYTVWLKRRSWTNIIIGGLAGSFAVLAGGASASPGFCLPPVLLAVVMFFWTPSHFWSFAVVHREQYQEAGIPMLPNVIGDRKTAWYILINTIILVASSLLLAWFGSLGVIYLVVASLLGAYFIYMNLLLLKDLTKETAYRNFKASMLYLGGLFLAIVLDVSILQ